MRSFWVRLHRWAGLAMAGLLIVVGLTGSLLAFLPELERLAAPNLFPGPQACTPLGQGVLAELAETRHPEIRANGVYLGTPGTALVHLSPRVDPSSGVPHRLDFDSLFLDPCTGDELGRRMFGDLSQGLVNLMPFVYKLHYALALGKWGGWILGICALVWTLDSFVGFYLTLPPRRRSAAPAVSAAGSKASHATKSLLARWKPAWQLRWRAGSFKLIFDLHRAGGLWFWVILLMFAWSSVFMNLHDQVYAPVTRTVLDYPPRAWEAPERAQPLDAPKLYWRTAQAVGELLLANAAQAQGFTVEQPVGLWLDRARGQYHYIARSSLDFQNKRGRTMVIFDADTGALKSLELPSGQHAGWTVTNWLQSLHEANVFGLPYRIFVSLLGLVITMLSLTGAYIWWKKRVARLKHSARRMNQRS